MPGGRFAALVLAGDRTPDDALLVASGHGCKAVSYTHLRAHETVLDLVCRLLLEKKKNKIHTDNSVIDVTLRLHNTATIISPAITH